MTKVQLSVAWQWTKNNNIIPCQEYGLDLAAVKANLLKSAPAVDFESSFVV